MQRLTLEMSPTEARLMWWCIVGQKARMTRALVERIDTYADLPLAMRKAADDLEYLGGVAKAIAVYCRDNGVDVVEGK